MNTKVKLFALSMLALGSTAADASLVVSNLANTRASGFDVGSTGATIDDSPLANSFTTGGGSTWILSSVVLNMNVEPAGTPIGDLSLFLYDDSSGEPGLQIGSFGTNNPSGATPTDYSFAPLAPIALQPSTIYWLVASATLQQTGANYVWSYTFDTSETGVTGWSIGDTSYAGWPANNWTALDIAGEVPVLFSVNADAADVPLPATALLMLPGIAAISFSRLRRRDIGVSRAR